MAIVVTNQGSTGQSTSDVAVLLPPASNIAAGSLIVVAVHDRATISTLSNMTVNDTASNTYTRVAAVYLGNVAADGVLAVFVCYNCNAITTGGTITFSNSGAVADAVMMAAFSATGIYTASTPVDLVNTTYGNSSTFTLTSGTPAVPGELFFGVVARDDAGAATQDTGNGWASPTGSHIEAGSSYANTIGGTQVNAGTGTLTYAPTSGDSSVWAEIILSFKPGTAAYTLTSAVAAFVLTGKTVIRALGFPVAVSAFVLTAYTTTLVHAILMAAAVATFTLTGKTAGQLIAHLSAKASFVLTGIAALLGTILPAGVAAFIFTGHLTVLARVVKNVGVIGNYVFQKIRTVQPLLYKVRGILGSGS